MNRITFASLLAISLLVTSCSENNPEVVNELLQNYSTVLSSKSAEDIASAFDRNAVIMVEGKNPVEGYDQIVEHFRHLESFDFEEEFDVEEIISAGEYFIVQTTNRGAWKSIEKNSSGSFVSKGQMVLKQDENNDWKIYRYSYSGNAPSGKQPPTDIKGKFAHIVFMWLKEPDNKQVIQEFETSLNNFISSSDFINSFHVGTPADTNRPIIDNTYTYCLIVTFDSKAEHDKYQVEPAHTNFLKESSGYWNKILIYDSVSE